jgi:maltose alpha-D-glucosyltransferase / alpha-amylase
VQGTALVPRESKDLETVLNTFLIEKSLTHFIDNIDVKPDYVIVPIHIIRSVLGITEEKRSLAMNT